VEVMKEILLYYGTINAVGEWVVFELVGSRQSVAKLVVVVSEVAVFHFIRGRIIHPGREIFTDLTNDLLQYLRLMGWYKRSMAKHGLKVLITLLFALINELRIFAARIKSCFLMNE
jgi:hypothetical protein